MMRNPAIELYRVLLMFLIVLHHAAYHGHWNHTQGLDAAYPSVYWLFTALTIWHVDGFLSITGWFGTRFSISRFVKLWGVIVFYSIFSVAYGCIVNGQLTSKYLAGGWFGCTYLYFILIVPFINIAIEKLIELPRRNQLIIVVLLNMAVFFNWSPYRLLTFVSGSGAGSMSIVQFVVVYVNLQFLKKSRLHERIELTHCLYSVAAFILTTILLKVVLRWDSWYDAPHVMLMAIAMLIVFDRYLKIPKWLEGFVLRLSPLTFGIYILHDTTTFGRLFYRIPQDWLCERWGGGVHPIVIIFLTAVFCFTVCVCVEALRRLIIKPISRKVFSYVGSLDKRFDFK